MWHKPNRNLRLESIVPASLDKSRDSYVISEEGVDSGN